jgi:hypothetical protein
MTSPHPSCRRGMVCCGASGGRVLTHPQLISSCAQFYLFLPLQGEIRGGHISPTWRDRKGDGEVMKVNCYIIAKNCIYIPFDPEAHPTPASPLKKPILLWIVEKKRECFVICEIMRNFARKIDKTNKKDVNSK